MTDPIIKRAIKLTGLAIGISICLFSLSFFLPPTYQSVFRGAAGGLIAVMLVFLIGLLRRAAAAIETAQDHNKKSKRIKIMTNVAVIVGLVLAVSTGYLFGHNVEMLMLGISLGILCAIAFIIGPIFDLPARRTNN
jgi:undecaprenyl pyrophosphate phosphatase UppP